MRERGARRATPTLDRPPEADWGWIDVTSLQLRRRERRPGRPHLVAALHRARRRQSGRPDGGGSAARPARCAPGETVNVEIAWTSRVPRTFARTGAIGNYYFLAQWFPKIGVLEDTGWNCHQFHAGTEFFSDFGIYDVRLTVPSGWVVGATGVERGRRDEGDGTTTHRYYAGGRPRLRLDDEPGLRRAHASGSSIRPAAGRDAPAAAARARRPGGAPLRRRRARRCATTASGSAPIRTAHITIVDPAWQSGAGGMEYPTLFTAGTRWLAPRAGRPTPEDVTVHEAGHQFWYGIVATNEFEHAWMDEGLNTFATARALEQFFGPKLLRRSATSAASCRGCSDDLPLSRGDRRQPPGAYRPRRRRRRAVDADVALLARRRRASSPTTRRRSGCNTLERMLGWDTLQRILSTYFARYAFKHPEPQDFFAVANEVSGRDLTWFFDQVYRSSSVFDYGVDAFTQRAGVGPRLLRRRGQADVLGQRALRRRRYRTTLVVRRYGDGDLPGRRPRRVRERAGACAGSGTAASAGSCSRSTGRCAPCTRRGRSRARAAARRQLHEQLAHAGAEDAMPRRASGR